jgi:hypothetical protein
VNFRSFWGLLGLNGFGSGAAETGAFGSWKAPGIFPFSFFFLNCLCMFLNGVWNFINVSIVVYVCACMRWWMMLCTCLCYAQREFLYMDS